MSALPPKLERLLTWAPAALGGLGVLLIVWLAVGGWAHVGASVLAILALLVVAVAVTMRVRRNLHRLPRSGEGPSAAPAISGGPLREAFDALPEPLLVIAGRSVDDPGGRRILMANRASQVLFQITPQGGQLVSAIRDPKVLEAVEGALFRDRESDVEFAPGGQHDLHWRAEIRPMPVSEGGDRLVMLHLRDETEARRLERMRADFMANASHELRSPLASLTGFIETLQGAARDDPAARERFLDIMAVQGERMGRLISDLLSLSRIELNEHVPPEGVVDLGLVAGDVADALTPLLKGRGLRVDLSNAGKGQAVIAGDRDQMVQVVQNLVENGLKYSPDGGAVEIDLIPGFRPLDPATRFSAMPRVTLLRPAHQAGVRYAAIRVRDRGAGIDRQQLPRLTERFYRIEGQKSGDKLGTGLGLAIVKHIVNRHRGGLIVESAPGEGSIFTVYLPEAAEKSTGQAGDRSKTVMQAS